MRHKVSTFLGVLLMCSVVGWAQAGGGAGGAGGGNSSSDNNGSSVTSPSSGANVGQSGTTTSGQSSTSSSDNSAAPGSTTGTYDQNQNSQNQSSTATDQNQNSTQSSSTTTTSSTDQSTDQSTNNAATTTDQTGASAASAPATTTTSTTTTIYTGNGNDNGSGMNDISVQVTGLFNRTSHGAFVNHIATNSAGLLVNYRGHLNNWAAAELNYGFTRNSQRYESITTPDQVVVGQSTSIPSNVHELSADLVGHTPLWGVQPFALVGGGLMAFQPRVSGLRWQGRGMWDYGVGVDFRLYHVGLRLQARELNYKAPDFRTAGFVNNGRWTHLFQPSAGIVFTF